MGDLSQVIFTDNKKPYKQRKVRILNGAHTSFVSASYLAGNDTVLESMEDELIFKFVKGTVFDEIIPTMTALDASGAHIVLFTTGRGTPFASPVPAMKIASNSGLADRKPNWIDFNAGTLVEGSTMEEMAEELFSLVLETASGRKVCSERAGFHDMAIFKQGVTL